MIRNNFLFFFLMSYALSFGQENKHGYPCGGLDIVDVGVHIKGFKEEHQNEISASVLRQGFKIALTDTSFKLIRFIVSYSTGNSVSEYRINGSVVNKKNAKFLKDIQPGDFLSLECINIEKEGFESLSTTLLIVAIK